MGGETSRSGSLPSLQGLRLMGQGVVPRGDTEFKNVVSRGSLGC